MNKKEIAYIRNQFKLNNERMKIHDIFNVYVKKETSEIYHEVCQSFALLEQETQELFLTNFKKVLPGSLDTKLFELKFRYGVEDSTQSILYEALETDAAEDWKESMMQIVEKMVRQTVYEFDTVITFIRGELRKPVQKRNPETEEGGMDSTYSSPFILCSVNKIEQPKKALFFDYVEKEFKSSNILDPIINLNKPLTGFFFPAINDHGADVNHILYYTGKTNQPDYEFIEDVLHCEEIMTAQDDKDCFDFILQQVVGDEVESTIIANVYQEIDQIVQENEEDEEDDSQPMLDSQDIERILTVSGVENVNKDKVEHALKTVLDDEKYEFKANNIMPKTIKIETKVANLTLKPKDLQYVKYITFQGKRCILIEIEDDVVLEGFRLEAAEFN